MKCTAKISVSCLLQCNCKEVLLLKQERKTYVLTGKGKENSMFFKPNNFSTSIYIPTKKQSLAAEFFFLLSHRAVLWLNFTHNHPLNAADTLGLRLINETTKQQIFDHFDKGHSSSSARYTHEQKYSSSMLKVKLRSKCYSQIVPLIQMSNIYADYL